jgi:hypothetical protein
MAEQDPLSAPHGQPPPGSSASIGQAGRQSAYMRLRGRGAAPDTGMLEDRIECGRHGGMHVQLRRMMPT